MSDGATAGDTPADAEGTDAAGTDTAAGWRAFLIAFVVLDPVRPSPSYGRTPPSPGNSSDTRTSAPCPLTAAPDH